MLLRRQGRRPTSPPPFRTRVPPRREGGGQGLQQRPRDLRVLLDERPELPRGHAAAAQVGGRRDGRRARPLVDQRDLAEVVAGAEGADDLTAEAHGGVAVLDQEEPDAAATLGGDRLTLVEAALPHHLGEPAELLVADAREKRNALEMIDEVSHRARSYPPIRARLRQRVPLSHPAPGAGGERVGAAASGRRRCWDERSSRARRDPARRASGSGRSSRRSWDGPCAVCSRGADRARSPPPCPLPVPLPQLLP